MLSSCSSDDLVLTQASSEYFKVVGGDTIVIDGKAVSAKFSVTADCYWTIAKVAWPDLQVTPDRGEGSGIVAITTSQNNTPFRRQGILKVVTGEGIAKVMTVRQMPGDVQMSLSVVDKLTFGTEGGDNVVSVSCNTAWKVSGGSDWCSFEGNDPEATALASLAESLGGTVPMSYVPTGYLNGSFTVKALPNPSTSTRTAKITVTPLDGKPVTFVVEQNDKAISLSVSPQSLSFAAIDQQMKTIGIVCNDDWTIVATHDWLNLSVLSGSGDGSAMVGCEPNNTGLPRQGEVIVQSGGKLERISVTQAAREIESVLVLSPHMVTFKASGMEEHEVSVICNDEWIAQSSDSWLHLSELHGYGDGMFIVYSDMNDTGEERWGTIIVRSGRMEAMIEVVQNPAEPATITVPQITGIRKDQAVVSFTYDSEIPVTVYGICYSSETEHPDMNSSPYVSLTGSDTQGSPMIELTGLSKETTYYVRAFVKRPGEDVQYSETAVFTTLSGKPGENDNVTP